MTDAIADLATRIRNAYLAKHKTVEIPHSKIKEEIAKILEKEGYVGSVAVNKKPRILIVGLIYKDGQPMLDKIERISKPGRRTYMKTNRIPRTLGGYGLIIISTSRGVMTDKDARKAGVGGEALLRVW